MIQWISKARARTKMRRSLALRRELQQAVGLTSVGELARRARVPFDFAESMLELWWIAGLVERTSTGHSELRRHAYELTARGRLWTNGENKTRESAA